MFRLVSAKTLKRLVAVSCLLAVIAGPSTLYAQPAAPSSPEDATGYTVDKLGEPARDRSRLQIEAGQILAGASLSGREAQFDRFWNDFHFAEMTQPSNLSNLSQGRKRLLTAIKRGVANPAARDHLLKLTVAKMIKWASENYHPHVRYEAIYIIGQLNDREGTTAGEPAVPYKAGVPILLDALQNPKFPDAVKVAAMKGLQRHAEAKSLANADAVTFRNVALAMLNQKEPPAGRDSKSHEFLRGAGADILATIGDVGQDGSVIAALDSIIADETAPVGVRTAAAGALGRFNLNNAGIKDPVAVIEHLGRVAVAVCRAEIAKVTDEKSTASGRLLLHRLRRVLDGLQGTAVIAILDRQEVSLKVSS